MKILAFTAFYPPHHQGGYELRCKDVLEGLQHEGHEILLLTNCCLDPDCQEHKNEPTVERVLKLQQTQANVFSRIWSDNIELIKIQKTIRSFQPDLLYTWHLQNLSDAILPFLASLSIPLVHDEGGSEMIYLSRLQKRGLYFYKIEQDSAIKRWLKQGIKKYATFISGERIVPDWEWPANMNVYFNSHFALKHAREMGVPIEGAVVIPSGIAISKFPFQARAKISSPVKIVIPARIKEQKGCRDGILLVDELRMRNIPAKLSIIGEVQSIDYYNELVKITNDMKLNDSVDFRAMVSQEELSSIYQHVDICFFTSYFKTGFSRVPLEAMASGCLVFSYGNEGSNESVKQGETGIILEEGNIKGAADRIEELLVDQPFYLGIIENARSCVENNFSMETYVSQIDNYLKQCLQNR